MRQKKIWKHRWEPADNGEWQRSGGQGRLRLVRQIGHEDGPLSVLKELKKQDDMERRRRMRREIVALETLPHCGAATLLDHNTDGYSDTNIELYAVFELVPGPTLQERIRNEGPLPLDDAIALVKVLLDTLKVYHDSGFGHRDIKPDNIILRGGDPAAPVLVDFGLTFNVEDPPSNDTPDWQQVGNRFLSLPEHAAFSGNKRDLRSDLAFCVGILFFALTGHPPVTLADEDGLPPHQRAAPRAILDATPEWKRLPLLTVFGRGFVLNLSHRFQSIEDLTRQIDRITSTMADEEGTEANLADIRSRAAAKSANMVIRVGLDSIRARIKAAAVTVIKELGEAFDNSIEEKLTTMSDMRTWIRCGASNVYDGWLTNTYFVIRAVGGELVVAESLDPSRSDGATVARIPVEAPNSGSDLEQTVRTTIIRNVQRDMAYR